MSTPPPGAAQPACAGDPLADHLRGHAHRALSGLTALELDADLDVDAVHDTRTSLRRVRAAMRTFARSFPVPGTVDEDLRFVALALGAVRDADVLAEALAADLDALPLDQVPAPARRALHGALASRRRTALDAAQRARTDPRWGRAVAQLRAWQDDPPGLAGQDLVRTLETARRRVRRRIRESGGEPAALHSARKAAKRWRYAAELLSEREPAAHEHLERATEAQTVLGQVQDALIMREFLREHAGQEALSAQDAFSTRLLYARAQRRLEKSTEQALRLL